MTNPAVSPRTVALRCAGVWKAYGSHAVLKDLNIVVHTGEVCALLGRNGAGKSTLVKILSGAIKPDHGAIYGPGEAPLRFASPREAMRDGIIPVHQKLTLFPQLSVRENLLGFHYALHRSRREAAPRSVSSDRIASLLARLELNATLDTPVGALPLEDRQVIEIGRALVMNPRLLILDEPTAAADVKAVERLHNIIRELTKSGIAVVYVSHRLDEVREIADTLTLLRDGRAYIENAPITSVSNEEIATAMSADIGAFVPSPTVAVPRNLAVDELAATNVVEIDAVKLRSNGDVISARIESGEITGLAGLAGSGVIELGLALAGVQRPLAGNIRLNGQTLRGGDRPTYVRAGIGLIPQDRDAEGLFGILSALHNVSFQTLSEDSSLGVISPRAQLRRIISVLESLRVRPLDPYAAANSFSGGNAQKLVIGRQIADRRLRVLVALEPTRGVDASARSQVWRELTTLRDRGIVVIIASTDTDELVHLCGTVHTMIDGSLGPTLMHPLTEPEVFNAIAVSHANRNSMPQGRA